jgi:diguanylate cyclase (GGDEF)-like protein/PAS domain S-box-containing protein
VTATFDPIQLADYATEMVSLHDGDGRFVTASAVSHDVLGYEADELVGRRLSDLVHPEDARALETAFDGVPGEPRPGAVTATCRLRHAEGYWAWTEVTVRPAPGALDRSTIVSIRGAAELVAARQSAEWAEQTLRQVFHHAPTGMAIVGLDGRFERVNPAFCALLDTSADQLLGRTVAGLSDGGDAPADRFALSELVCGRIDQVTGTQAFLRADGAPVTVTTRRSIGHSATGRQHVVLHVLAVRDAAAAQVSPVARIPEQGVPVTARPEQPRPEAVRANQPRTGIRPSAGGVTGLTSRSLLLDRLNVAAGRPERQTSFLVMFFVDVDGAAKILTKYGRHSLEGVLSATGNRLRATLRIDDTVARFGDRGFVVLCPVVANSADVVAIRQRLAKAIADGPIVIDGRKFTVAGSVGAALVGPGEACDPEALLGRADEAMAVETARS